MRLLPEMQLPRPEAVNIFVAVAMFAIMAISTIDILLFLRLSCLLLFLVVFTAPHVVFVSHYYCWYDDIA